MNSIKETSDLLNNNYYKLKGRISSLQYSITKPIIFLYFNFKEFYKNKIKTILQKFKMLKKILFSIIIIFIF